ncbi:MAG: hypothetical protein RIA69_19330 [Cyclobacteriaceae bacterium]
MLTKKWVLKLILSVLSVSYAISVIGQSGQIKTIGLPLITNYSPANYSLTNQNFDVIIDDQQRILFANDGGILIFDGLNWQQIILPKTSAVYSLEKAKD